MPTFAYWKGMIEPRRSDGLFDLTDIFTTSLGLVGVRGAAAGDAIGKANYLTGIDQTSFLLAKDGASNRRSIAYFWGNRLAAVRMDEFKIQFLAHDSFGTTPNGNHGGFTGTVAQTAGGMMYNLYANPQEDSSIAIRHIPAAAGLSPEVNRYQEMLKKYPPNVVVNFTGQ